jgi:hypothetical protein
MTEQPVQQQPTYEQRMLWLAEKQARTLDAIKVAVWVLASVTLVLLVLAAATLDR